MNTMKMWVLRLFLFLSVLELRNSFSIHMFMQYVNVEILSCLDYSLDHERRIGNLRGQYWLNFVRQLQDINCFWKGTCSFIERKLQLHLKKKKTWKGSTKSEWRNMIHRDYGPNYNRSKMTQLQRDAIFRLEVLTLPL